MNSSHDSPEGFVFPIHEIDVVRAWQRVAFQAAKENNPRKLMEFSRALQRKLNKDQGHAGPREDLGNKQ
jgi:hypothetical protein